MYILIAFIVGILIEVFRKKDEEQFHHTPDSAIFYGSIEDFDYYE